MGQALTKEEILKQVQATLVDMFDFSPDLVQPSARLVQELDFDSIDILNMIIKLESLLGRKVRPEQLKDVKTVQDVVNALDLLLREGA